MGTKGRSRSARIVSRILTAAGFRLARSLSRSEVTAIAVRNVLRLRLIIPTMRRIGANDVRPWRTAASLRQWIAIGVTNSLHRRIAGSCRMMWRQLALADSGSAIMRRSCCTKALTLSVGTVETRVYKFRRSKAASGSKTAAESAVHHPKRAESSSHSKASPK